jgi:hypothetical protein
VRCMTVEASRGGGGRGWSWPTRREKRGMKTPLRWLARNEDAIVRREKRGEEEE